MRRSPPPIKRLALLQLLSYQALASGKATMLIVTCKWMVIGSCLWST